MAEKLRADWYRRDIDPSVKLDAAGVYQWLIKGVGLYVGKAKKLRRRLRAYPRNVLAMINGLPWHGIPEKKFRDVHVVLRAAHDAGTSVVVTVLEVCDPAARAERERYWIDVRRTEAERGGPPVLNSDRRAKAPCNSKASGLRSELLVDGTADGAGGGAFGVADFRA